MCNFFSFCSVRKRVRRRIEEERPQRKYIMCQHRGHIMKWPRPETSETIRKKQRIHMEKSHTRNIASSLKILQTRRNAWKKYAWYYNTRIEIHCRKIASITEQFSSIIWNT